MKDLLEILLKELILDESLTELFLDKFLKELLLGESQKGLQTKRLDREMIEKAPGTMPGEILR